MNNACPQCGAVYNVTSNDIGRRIACKKCRTPLVVEEDGLHLEEEPIPSTELPEPDYSRPRRRQPSLMSRVLTMVDVPTMLFGAGMFFTVVFAFFPAIDQANATRQQAAINEGEYLDQIDQLEVDRFEGSPSERAKLEKAREERAKAWQKKREILQLEAKLAETDAKRALVWNQRGLLFGFLLLSFAGIGFMTTQQPPSRKILGGVLLLLVFLAATRGGLTLTLGDV